MWFLMQMKASGLSDAQRWELDMDRIDWSDEKDRLQHAHWAVYD